MTIRESFREQSDTCAALGSPFTGRLLALLAEGLSMADPVGRKVLTWSGDPTSGGAAVALRLAGALHALVREGYAPLAMAYPPNEVDNDALWTALAATLEAEAGFILARLDLPPQTNEVRRAAALYPGLMLIAAATGLPLVLSEIGASAGLNLRMNRFRYRFGDLEAGMHGSPVVIETDWQGPAPAIAAVKIRDVAGCDIAPLDPHRPNDAARLMSYLWPDQPDRLARAEAAIGLAAADDIRVTEQDAVSFLRDRLAAPRAGQAHVIYHSIAWQYLTTEDKVAGERLIEAAGASATPATPLAWLRMENDGQSPGAALALDLWPGPQRLCLGRADFHGRWVNWAGAAPQSLR